MSLDPDFPEEQKPTKSLHIVHNILKAPCLSEYRLLNNKQFHSKKWLEKHHLLTEQICFWGVLRQMFAHFRAQLSQLFTAVNPAKLTRVHSFCRKYHPCSCRNRFINKVLFALPKFLFCYIYTDPFKKNHLPKTIRLCKYKQGQNKCYSWWAFERKKDDKKNAVKDLMSSSYLTYQREDLKVPSWKTKFQ